MGTVWLAEDTRLHRRVALKFLQPGIGASLARRAGPRMDLARGHCASRPWQRDRMVSIAECEGALGPRAGAPTETSHEPLFRMLGTPAEHKRRIVYDVSHTIPRNELIKEFVGWMEKYWGTPSALRHQ